MNYKLLLHNRQFLRSRNTLYGFVHPLSFLTAYPDEGKEIHRSYPIAYAIIQATQDKMKEE